MTRVTYYNDETYHYLHMTGHATYEGPPHDAEHRVGRGGAAERVSPGACAGAREAELVPTKVCAGVSAIVYALAGWLANFGTPEQDTVILDSGKAFFSVDSSKEGVQAAFDLAVIGLLQIAKAHPDHLKVDSEKIF